MTTNEKFIKAQLRTMSTDELGHALKNNMDTIANLEGVGEMISKEMIRRNKSLADSTGKDGKTKEV